MTIEGNSFFKKISLFIAVLGFSFLHGTLALATPEEPLENDDGNWVFINAEGIIDAPLSIVADHFKDVKKADSMIPGLKIKRIVEQISDGERIDYDHFEMPWPFKDRYTIYRAREKIVNGQEILLTMNPLDNLPFEQNDKVAVRIKESSFLLKSLSEDESKTRVTIKLTVDPGGYLPVWFVNLNAKSWSKDLFKNLRKNIRKENARQNISRTNLTGNASTGASSRF